MSRKSWVELKNIETWIGDKKVIKELSLSLYLQESTVILGPNGSGKSSIINLISRELYPVIKDDLEISFFQSKHYKLEDLRKKISIVSTSVWDRTNKGSDVLSIVHSGTEGKMGNLSSHTRTDETNRNVKSCIVRMGLVGLQKELFGRLSEGQKKKVLIARALVSNPEVVVLDEPMNMLDLKALHGLMKIQRELISNGITLLIATHRIDTIVPEIKRILLVSEGRIIQDGTPKEILTSYNISSLYKTPVEVHHINDYWNVIPITKKT